MFYRPEDGHGLPHSPFAAIIAPRPIAWVSTRGDDGQDNLAPYSFFNAVAYEPPQIMFASTSTKPDRGDTKDSIANIRETGVFCVNLVSHELRDAMNATSGSTPREVDEFQLAGLEKADCETIPCSRVKQAPASLECKLVRLERLPGAYNFVCFGEVTGVHMRDEHMRDGYFDTISARLLARLGYKDYTVVKDAFSLTRPQR